MRSEPDLEDADRLKLKKSDESPAMEPMKLMEPMKPMEPMRPLEPMRPMEPMKPMKPMEPMKPMGSMRPMELRMGDMHMSMGSVEKESVEKEPQTAKRFCTQCGKPVQIEDRFCASCGHPLSGQK
jgi:hypothetical protein